MMEDIDKFLAMLRRRENFSLSRFNDGEMMAIQKVGCKVARGDQVVTRELSSLLKEAISFEGENYWVGLPCPACFPKWSELADSLVRDEYDRRTLAVVLTNRNWLRFVTEFGPSVGERDVIWVSGESQEVDKISERYPSLTIRDHIKLPTRNAFSKLGDVCGAVEDFKKNDLVVLSCGPLSRVLSYLWWKERKDCTYLDVGSAFDPFTRGVRHRCHKWNKEGTKNTLPHCEICN